MYIYEIVNTTNQKRYIGQTIQNPPTKRWQRHQYKLKKNIHENCYLQNAWNVVNDPSKWVFNILEDCNNVSLDEKEIYWIEKLNSKIDGYNLRGGGKRGHMPISAGIKLSKILKQKWLENPNLKSKIYKCHIQAPDKTIYFEIQNSAAFARTNGLAIRSFRRLLEGYRKSYKGWINLDYISSKHIFSELKDPYGNVYMNIENLSEFCRQKNINYDKIWLLLNRKKKIYKGWTLTEHRV